MVDIKLLSKVDNELEGPLRTMKAFINDTWMESGLDKYAEVNFQGNGTENITF